MIPHFKTTQDALNFGLLATEEEREALRERRESTLASAIIANLEGRKQTTHELLRLAQFDREALEAQKREEAGNLIADQHLSED